MSTQKTFLFIPFLVLSKCLGLKKCENCSVSASGINRKGTQGPELPDRKADYVSRARIANLPEMPREVPICGRSDPCGVKELLGAKCSPQTRVLLTLSVHSSFNWPSPRHGSWINQMDIRV